MRALIVGLGSIGRRHLANLRRLAPDASIVVWHQYSRPSDRSSAPTQADSEVFSLEHALDTRPEMAVIAGPAPTHVETALALADNGVHLLVEKPISHSLDGVDDLIERCRARQLALLVGYNLRFSASLQEMKRILEAGRIGRVLSIRAEVGGYLPDWRPNSDYRRDVSARSELGGGVLLELSHEIDYVRWLAGDVTGVSARVGRLSDLEIDVEDVAEVILEFASGAIGCIHLDMVQRSPTRTCRVIGSDGTLTWDGITGLAAHYSAATSTWTALCPEQAEDRNESYLAELRHFLDCVDRKAVPLVNGTDGRRVLGIALAARQSSMERRAVNV